MRVALVNTNRIRPPIAPIGIEYIAETLGHAGHTADILDLCWEDDWQMSMDRFFSRNAYPVVGITIRNTDDCAFSTRHSFLDEIFEIVEYARNRSGALSVLGGVGFSTMPEMILEYCDADAGIHGAGEYALVELVRRIEAGEEWYGVPGIVYRDAAGWKRNPKTTVTNLDLPLLKRNRVDNKRYFREGGQAGIETKRGCPWHCTYCCEPLAKGSQLCLRPPRAVAMELESLLEQGIDHIHTCDSEFNLPPHHAKQICEEIIRRGLGERIRWYAYCTPAPFDRTLARLMRSAGCVGINFGADSGDAGMLRNLKRRYSPDDILNAVRYCRKEGIVTMLDLLLGAPGESRESIERTLDLVRESGAERIGISSGIRVWPGTEMARQVQDKSLQAGLVGDNKPLDPQFFIEPALSSGIFDLIDRLIGDDERFFFFNPEEREKNYNYDNNQLLVDAIAAGQRGAYWDILRKLSN